ncbi:MAG: rRNA maturation RNase YbeY [Candidatus Aureabacteria bacterium]|nr:rRNA maturation RNase YbeY [Candidatus Auribacterota bacterium]
MKVLIRSRLRTRRIDLRASARFAEAVLRRAGCPPRTELSVLFAGSRAIRGLNRRYRHSDRDTDVLSFPLGCGGGGVLGDIAISVDRAFAMGRALGTTANRELLLYLVHGILHLCGYDDETPAGRRVMERRQEAILTGVLRRGRWRVLC